MFASDRPSTGSSSGGGGAGWGSGGGWAEGAGAVVVEVAAAALAAAASAFARLKASNFCLPASRSSSFLLPLPFAIVAVSARSPAPRGSSAADRTDGLSHRGLALNDFRGRRSFRSLSFSLDLRLILLPNERRGMKRYDPPSSRRRRVYPVSKYPSLGENRREWRRALGCVRPRCWA